MRVVLDTNVLVSAVLSPSGVPRKILSLILNRTFHLLVSPEILCEYREVLHRKEFAFNQVTVDGLLQMFEDYGEKIVSKPFHTSLPDPDDLPFIECAFTGKADFLITGNIKHFPSSKCSPIRVLSPAEFLEMFKE